MYVAMKIDPYKHKEKFLKWKESTRNGIPDISQENSDIILRYISDMENGLNVSAKSVKGPRSYIRLNNLRQRLLYLAKQFEKHLNASLLSTSEEQLVSFFNSMRNGSIRRKDGMPYQSVMDYVNPMKSFWHWHMKVSRKAGLDIIDITEYLDTSKTKPRWVYLTEEEIRRLCDAAQHKYKVLMMFLYDTGIRSPTELMNIRVDDLYDNCKKVHIRDEIAKKGSFGRKVNLMLCPDLVRQYIKDLGLNKEDYLFPISPPVTNRYLKRLAKRVFGEGLTPAGDTYSALTMYDFRHCSCCYWLPRYKSESALKYRFGWRKSDKIHYYSELLGMKDTITEEDMLVDITKTEIEKRLLKTEQENDILKEKIEGFSNEARELKSLMKVYLSQLKQPGQLILSS